MVGVCAPAHNIQLSQWAPLTRTISYHQSKNPQEARYKLPDKINIPTLGVSEKIFKQVDGLRNSADSRVSQG